MSDDSYEFTFTRLNQEPPVDRYFDHGPGGLTNFNPESVVLFSGGLDSLAGVVQEAFIENHRLALVSHRSSVKTAKRQRDLVDCINQIGEAPLFHIPVWIHKGKELGREYTQRTRSFLFSSLGAVIARIYDLWFIRLYENGVISLNLPISGQEIGARASRTTHPLVLKGFSELFSKLFNGNFRVENPFIWKTKGEIVDLIVRAGYGDLIKYTSSCTHTWEMTKLWTHCGRCSQCIDRRFAVLGTGNADKEPAEMYRVDLLRGEREPGTEVTMVESYARTWRDVQDMSELEFFTKYGEVSRIVRNIEGSPDENANNIYQLYKRHSQNVSRVIVDALRDCAPAIHAGTLPQSCLVILALPQEYRSGQTAPRTPSANGSRFPTPAGAAWGEVEINFRDGETVSIKVRDVQRVCSFQDVGMRNQKNNRPTVQWELLRVFAQQHGTLTWDSGQGDRRFQKRKEILAKNLQDFFGIDGDPFELTTDGQGWRCLFGIQPDSTLTN